MLGGMMSIAKRFLSNISKQFISVAELVSIISDCEDITLQESAQWLKNHPHILRRSKRLVLENSYTLIEYTSIKDSYYKCPIKTIELVANGEDCDLWIDEVGFSRMLMLEDLKSNHININDELIISSVPYHTNDCLESDDNFYKNQCIYLQQKIEKNANILQLNTQKTRNNKDINYYHYIDKESSLYVPAFALLLRLHHDLNYLERYDGTKQERIFTMLEEYGEHYKVQATLSNALYFSNLIKTREASKRKSKEIIQFMLQDTVQK